mgnify:CR=1 FL=1
MRSYRSRLKPLGPMDFSAIQAMDAKKNAAGAKAFGQLATEGVDFFSDKGGVDNLDAKIDSLTSDENISNITTDENGFITPDVSVANYDFDLDPRGFDVAPISLGSSIDALSSDANIEAASQNIFDYNPESMGFLDLMKKGKGIFS